MGGGVDGVGGPKTAVKAQAPVETKKVETPKTAAPEPAKAKKPAEGFDPAKKKLMSVSGRFKAGEPPKPQADLSNLVAQQRAAANANLSAPKPVAMAPGPSGVNTTTTNKPSASGPVSKKEWDNPALLLGKLTQNPAAGGPTNNSGQRCGPSNLLGAALMEGPDAAAKYLNKVADAPENNRLSDGEKKELREIADKVKNKTATFEELGRAQDLTYRAGNRVMDVDQSIKDALAPPQNANLSGAEQTELNNLLTKNTWAGNDTTRVGELVSKASGFPSRVVENPDAPGTYLMTVQGGRSAVDQSGFTDKEIGDLAGIGGTKQSTTQMGDTETVKSIFKDLKPGESAIIRVAGTPGGTDPDHFVTVGRRKDGTAYIYNPDPAKGDSTVYVGKKGEKQDAGFMKELQRYEDRTGFDPNGKLPQITRVKVD